ncbi:hypothetical protein HDF24_22765 [Mucilaginibacter sp. X4EP1]|uniref:hypothetical protein n=1 Tax=Mucilaginibacter sp. X4EP1 TaxID=2723092 RepID=UPI003B00F06B
MEEQPQLIPIIEPTSKSTAGTITLWISILSGAITLILTVVNSYTSNRIKQREDNLKSLEFQLKAKSEDLEQQKANVDRYQWVFSHFSDIEDTDPRKRNFTTSLIRLALSKNEAEQLFNSLQNSEDTLLQTVGQVGIANINSEPIAALVGRLDASTADDRISAFNELKGNYLSSSAAIDLVLNLYTNNRIGSLSPNGVINGLYFLGSTDVNAWTKQQIGQGYQVLLSLKMQRTGQKTKDAIDFFSAQIKRLTSAIPIMG